MSKTTCGLLGMLIAGTVMAMGPYQVTHEGNDLILVCEKYETIRFHTSPNYVPWQNLRCNPRTKIRVKPGQWVEGYIGNPSDGKLTYLRDADNT